MICQVVIMDEDGENALEVRHTVSGEIVIDRYGERELGLDYDEARDLAAALNAILASMDRLDGKAGAN